MPIGALVGRVALVTGSTRGIGRAIAELFAVEGAAVIVNGRKQADAERAADEIDGRVIGIGADQSSLDEIRALCRRAEQHFGPVDVLVNNAAIAPRTAITRITDNEWDETLLVNLTAPFWYIRELVPGMKKSGWGSILNVTSGAAISGTVGFSSYAAAKGGLNALSATLAVELQGFGIRTNLLCASAMTDMMRQLPAEIFDPSTRLPSVEANEFAQTVDIVVSPVTLDVASLAPAQDFTRVGDVYTLPASLTGAPTATIPTGLDGTLPIGIQLIGRRWHDATVLAAARVIETAVLASAAP
jgi:NAD(P)-dependent dehydrogenase (short-subunit alcohol dehydrogenase family)